LNTNFSLFYKYPIVTKKKKKKRQKKPTLQRRGA